MLHNLPAEIIVSVSSFLEFNDKLNLTATCRKLNDLISNTNLYEALNLSGYTSEAGHIIEEFRRKPFKGAQVKVLELDLDDLSEEMISQLSRIFPNVTRFSSGDEYSYDDVNHFTLSPISEPLATWMNTLEVYRSNFDWFPIWLALEHHVFPRLTELEIVEDLDSGKRLIKKNGFRASYHLPFIKNAPFLKKLTIDGPDVSLDLLEALHEACPFIKSLILKPSVFLISNNGLPETIVPATTVTSLNIDDTTCCDKNGLLLDYILRKYPSLQHLSFTINDNRDTAKESLNSCYPGCSSYYINCDESDDYYDTYDDVDDNGSGIKRKEYLRLLSICESTLKIYRSSAPMFISRLPKTIKSLEVKTKIFPNIIKILSKSDLRIVKLGTEHYTESQNDKEKQKQLSYLKYLTSLKTMKTGLYLSSKVSNQGIVSASITKLNLYNGMSHLNIDWVLSAFPYLEELYLTGPGSMVAQVDDESKANPRRAYSNLRKLRVFNGGLQAGIFDYIKLAAPNLKELDLNSSTALGKTAVHLDLSGWGLKKCSLNFTNHIGSSKDRNYKITLDNITRIFIFDSDKRTVMFPKKTENHRQYRNLLHASIKCDDIKHLTVHGFRIKKMGDDVMIVT